MGPVFVLCAIIERMITTHGSEHWDVMDRGVDLETGFERCHVRRIALDTTTRATVWRLVKRPNGWYNVGQIVSGLNHFRRCPERNGVKLSNSRTDLTLLSFAETGHGNAYA